MKKLKQLLTVTFITFSLLINFNVIAQQNSKTNSNTFSVNIPDDLKMTTYEKANNTLIKTSRYDPEIGGTIQVIGIVKSDGIVKFESILVPNQNLTRISGAGCTGGNYRACAIGCTDNPTNIGVILCTAYCVISCADQ